MLILKIVVSSERFYVRIHDLSLALAPYMILCCPTWVLLMVLNVLPLTNVLPLHKINYNSPGQNYTLVPNVTRSIKFSVAARSPHSLAAETLFVCL